MRTLLACIVLLAACDAYDSDLGPAPFYCGADDPQCPMGYTCKNDPASGKDVCVASDDSISTSFDCNDDSDLEPNDELAMAAMTTIDAMTSYSIDGRAICPAGDKDTYAFTVSSGPRNVKATITFQANGAALRGAILNTGGVPIQMAALVSGSMTTLEATARNLPNGLYYVQVYSQLGGSLSVNNYQLAVDVVP